MEAECKQCGRAFKVLLGQPAPRYCNQCDDAPALRAQLAAANERELAATHPSQKYDGVAQPDRAPHPSARYVAAEVAGSSPAPVSQPRAPGEFKVGDRVRSRAGYTTTIERIGEFEGKGVPEALWGDWRMTPSAPRLWGWNYSDYCTLIEPAREGAEVSGVTKEPQPSAPGFQSESPPAFGVEEGDRCNRAACPGVLEFEPPENCACHISAPCGGCVNRNLRCPVCQWTPEDDKPAREWDAAIRKDAESPASEPSTSPPASDFERLFEFFRDKRPAAVPFELGRKVEAVVRRESCPCCMGVGVVRAKRGGDVMCPECRDGWQEVR